MQLLLTSTGWKSANSLIVSRFLQGYGWATLDHWGLGNYILQKVQNSLPCETVLYSKKQKPFLLVPFYQTARCLPNPYFFINIWLGPTRVSAPRLTRCLFFRQKIGGRGLNRGWFWSIGNNILCKPPTSFLCNPKRGMTNTFPPSPLTPTTAVVFVRTEIWSGGAWGCGVQEGNVNVTLLQISIGKHQILWLQTEHDSTFYCPG